VDDAFSGDAVPLHLLTQEAFVEYFRHLKGDGILAIHISNRYVDLAPVVARDAESLRKAALVVNDPAEEGYDPAENNWVLSSGNPQIFQNPVFKVDYAEPAATDPKIRLWTDDYSNLLQILSFKD